jgi:hypothetical protein
MPFEITKTVLSWFGITLVETENPDERAQYYDDDRPTPPHHIEPNGKPRRYSKSA